MLEDTDVVALAVDMIARREGERGRLDRLLAYRRTGIGPNGVLSRSSLAGLPAGAPQEVVELARASRVNVMRYVVSSRVQDMYVEGFQTQDSPDNDPSWGVWQANGMDARQVGVHRAALTFGASYVVVLPGKPVPVVRGFSPRQMTVVYDVSDDEWPMCALWARGSGRWRLVDGEGVYDLRGSDKDSLRVIDRAEHGAGHCPVIRFRETEDLDVEVEGVIEPLIDLQDQINITSFGLHVAQHYGAFRQRYILGWLAENETQALKTGASRFMTFEDGPDDVKVGEFSQTELRGYIESREASIRHLATVSQTPVHELMGQFVNLSAEALEAARASHHAGVEENRIVAGEAWEQVLRLASNYAGRTVGESASVIWRDTTMRSLKEAVEALGTMAEKLGIPKQALWARIPGVAQHELGQWRTQAEQDGGLTNIMAILNQGPTES